PNEQFLFIRSTDHPVSFPANKDQVQLHDRYATEKDDPNGTTKWMPSKMRFIKKMMNSDHMVTNKPRRIAQGVLQDQTEVNQEGATSNHTHNSLNGIIRVCSDCNTTKTPLWRSGPRGPKSLCNACGIRQRKARRAAMAAAAAAANGGLIPNEVHTKARKEKRPSDDRTVPFKKRCKFTTGSAQKNVRFDDFTISLSKSSAFQYQVFPQDERDAAILLMALSCGLIRG
ncbi:putative GATA transcription factor 22, partial [Ananas comosus]